VFVGQTDSGPARLSGPGLAQTEIEDFVGLRLAQIPTPPQCQHAREDEEREKKGERQRELTKEKRERHEPKRGKRTKEGKKTGKAINKRGTVRVRREGKRTEREKKEPTKRDS